MKPPVRVGIIGYGYATKTFHAPLVACVPGLALTAVSSSDPAKVRSDWPGVEVVATPQALIARDDIDLVIVPTPNDTHHPIAHAALSAGKHVVVDKPFTLTRAEAHGLTALARQRGRVLSVFHNRRWDGDFLSVRELLAGGQLGRVTHVESHFDRFRPAVRGRWREQPGAGSGLWFDLGPHLLDQTLQLFGRPQALAVDLMTQRDGAVTDDAFHAQLRYADGLRVVLHASALAAAPGARFTIHGTRGSYVKTGLDPQEDLLKAGHRPDGASPWPLPVEAATLIAQDPQAPDLVHGSSHPVLPGRYSAYYERLLDAIEGRGANPVPAEEAADVVALLELGCASHRERGELPVPA
ncbi:oxidoreductase [Piscinibacter sp.]|uniref:oxidoreductase n=1 Tax=Piscinibacter sp. TaxID=1903157 RepID=UPI002BED69EC|nr:oxidoreductase [Albitalea sp.]HUG21873.1 oxidoreductase [Albitalea sp.]